MADPQHASQNASDPKHDEAQVRVGPMLLTVNLQHPPLTRRDQLIWVIVMALAIRGDVQRRGESATRHGTYFLGPFPFTDVFIRQSSCGSWCCDGKLGVGRPTT